MTGKMKLYIGLLALGVVVIGGGVWMLVQSPPEIEIPEGSPVIYEQRDYVMRGEFKYLYIYEDGSIIYIEEKGLRPPGGNPTRTWEKGKLFTQLQLDSLLAYLENSGLGEMDEYYQFPGKPSENPSGGISMGDMKFTITVNSDNLSKTVSAFGYLTHDNGETYPDMPFPLNDIYGRLRTVSDMTEEVYQEDISQ
ncbi:MAG: hypothetical protein PHQ43_13540 [Dehalococcoidales bacterium]|nr:hypothetical protein [Dehalococcoidales bacterium]